MKKFLTYTAAIIGLLLLSGFIWWKAADYQVYEDRPQKSMSEYVDLEQDFQKLFQLAKDGETIELPAGYFKFSKALILDGKNNITIKGAGIDKTVLSFRDQTEGAEGIRVANGNNIVLEDFTIQDAIGDNIKAIYVDTLTFRRIKTEWTGKPDPSLGAYGIYPVICKNVLIEHCEALRGSDSGLYVGQSENIVIRHNKTQENVCGINVENSGHVEIYDNETFHNTSGMTILDIPGLTRYLEDVKVYNNKIYDNTLANFAPAGNVAASTISGTGIMLWAGKEVSIYENEITDNPFPVVMVSFLGSMNVTSDKPEVPIAETEKARMEVSSEEEASLVESHIYKDYQTDKNYNPYSKDIVLKNNTWSFGSLRKKMVSKDGALITVGLMGKNAHIWYDGVANPDGNTFCMEESGDMLVANLDMMNDYKGLKVAPLSNKCGTKEELTTK